MERVRRIKSSKLKTMDFSEELVILMFEVHPKIRLIANSS